jgi:ATP-dependent Clp protease adapter protein ClpS
MSDVHADAGHIQLTFHDDDETPAEFVIELLRTVFKKPLMDAMRFIDAVNQSGEAVCDAYPRDVATELLETARQRTHASGYPLRISSKAVAGSVELLDGRCKLCGTMSGRNRLTLKGTLTLVCDDCMDEIISNLPEVTRTKQFNYACEALAWHFVGIPPAQLVASSRLFPGHMRADIQAAVDRLFSASAIRFFGIHEERRYETLTFAALTRDDRDAPAIAPAQYHDVDIGESAPVKCLHNGCGSVEPTTCATRSSSPRTGNTDMRPGPGSRLPYLRARRVGNSSNAASPSWRTPSTPRVAIAARSCRSTAMRIIGDAREASRSTDCHRLNART